MIKQHEITSIYLYSQLLKDMINVFRKTVKDFLGIPKGRPLNIALF